ncbi:hypothetical protein [Sphaerimonospora thailandensis]|uniref:Lipoprotein n=1 Tax=Sphaerimonospora thailandensis TaxID=795644 RepID=A0A8J3RFH1_9ACTN|nr:hypothetical protein [Sphaerimonospora thailandensis]GIH72927.1 hypothetical protein Mth01_51800 [Sphaerimonospora thailandensis]
MRFPTLLRRAIAASALLALMTACTSELEAKMTPEESRQVFITEAKAIIQAVFPGADPLVVVQVRDAPCGGPVGTDFSSVESMINVHSDARDEKLDPDHVFKQVIEVLKQQGWKINYTKDRIAGAEREGVGGISAGVGDSPVGINIGGDTECVENPEK